MNPDLCWLLGGFVLGVCGLAVGWLWGAAWGLRRARMELLLRTRPKGARLLYTDAKGLMR